MGSERFGFFSLADLERRVRRSRILWISRVGGCGADLPFISPSGCVSIRVRHCTGLRSPKGEFQQPAHCWIQPFIFRPTSNSTKQLHASNFSPLTIRASCFPPTRGRLSFPISPARLL